MVDLVEIEVKLELASECEIHPLHSIRYWNKLLGFAEFLYFDFIEMTQTRLNGHESQK